MTLTVNILFILKMLMVSKMCLQVSSLVVKSYLFSYQVCRCQYLLTWTDINRLCLKEPCKIAPSIPNCPGANDGATSFVYMDIIISISTSGGIFPSNASIIVISTCYASIIVISCIHSLGELATRNHMTLFH